MIALKETLAQLPADHANARKLAEGIAHLCFAELHGCLSAEFLSIANMVTLATFSTRGGWSVCIVMNKHPCLRAAVKPMSLPTIRVNTM